MGVQDEAGQDPEKIGTAGTTTACSTCADEKVAMKKYRRRLMAGLVLPFSLQSLDITIISGALPFIASDFGSFPSPARRYLVEARN